MYTKAYGASTYVRETLVYGNTHATLNREREATTHKDLHNTIGMSAYTKVYKTQPTYGNYYMLY